MAARLVGIPSWQFFKDDGSVNASGTLDFHDPGTSTDKSIWKDAAKATEHSNPVTLDSAGRVPNPIFVEGQYDVVVKDSAGTTIETISSWGDNFSTNSEQSPNLVCNGSFEDDDDSDGVPDDWTFDNGSSGARIATDRADGTASVKFTGTSSSSDSILSCFFPVSANSTYEISFEYYTSNASCTPKLEVQEYDAAQATNGTAVLFDPATSSTSWTKIDYLRYTPDAGDYWAKIRFYANQAGTSYDTYIDNVQVREIKSLAQASVTPYGLILSRDSGDTSHDINVTAGAVLDDAKTYPLYLETEMTKQLDAAWAVGDDAGGGDTGALGVTSDLIYVWLIGDSNAGLTDVLLSASATAPTMPSGWDKKRLIGAWRTDASDNLVDGLQKDVFFQFFADLLDINDSTVAHETYVTGTLTVPPDCLGLVVGFVDINTDFDEELYLDLKPTTATYSSFSDGAWVGVSLQAGAGQKIVESVMKEGTILVDSSSQMKYAMSSDATLTTGNATVKIYMRGFYMFTRDNP